MAVAIFHLCSVALFVSALLSVSVLRLPRVSSLSSLCTPRCVRSHCFTFKKTKCIMKRQLDPLRVRVPCVSIELLWSVFFSAGIKNIFWRARGFANRQPTCHHTAEHTQRAHRALAAMEGFDVVFNELHDLRSRRPRTVPLGCRSLSCFLVRAGLMPLAPLGRRPVLAAVVCMCVFERSTNGCVQPGAPQGSV